LLDRYRITATQASKFTVQQNAGSVTPPVGFSNYFGATVGASANVTVGAGDVFGIQQFIEGYNVADLAYGTASAAPITLSFWVRSSLTGTFGGSIQNSASSRSYPYTYTISAANTWEQKTVTIAGDTVTALSTTNGIGLRVQFNLGTGATSSGTAGAWASADYFSATGAVKLIETNSATFYITGVQLEKGSTATSFDYRPYGTELQLAQRYGYAVNNCLTGFANGTTVVDASFAFPVTMRSNPTLTVGTAVMTAFGTGGSFAQSSAASSLPSSVTQNGATLRFSNFTGLTSNAVYLINNAASGTVTAYSSFLSAEL
jgi:hypothetical protein